MSIAARSPVRIELRALVARSISFRVRGSSQESSVDLEFVSSILIPAFNSIQPFNLLFSSCGRVCFGCCFCTGKSAIPATGPNCGRTGPRPGFCWQAGTGCDCHVAVDQRRLDGELEHANRL